MIEAYLEQLRDLIMSFWSKVRESELFLRLEDRYNALPSRSQKIVRWGGALVAVMIFLTLPWSYFEASQIDVERFNNARDLIARMFKTARKAAQVESSGVLLSAVTSSELSGKFEMAAKLFRISPEQGPQLKPALDAKTMGTAGAFPSSLKQEGTEISFSKLTLRQIVDLGARVDSELKSRPAKLTGIEITRAAVPGNYFDVSFRIVSFVLATPESKKPATRNSRKKGTTEE